MVYRAKDRDSIYNATLSNVMFGNVWYTIVLADARAGRGKGVKVWQFCASEKNSRIEDITKCTALAEHA